MFRGLAEIAAKTPVSRDRYVDFLRAFSIATVVVGHWFISLVYWRKGVIGSTSAIGVTPWMWLATWFLYVMPIFFFVGGFSNLVTFESFERRALPVKEFLKTRTGRLLRPSLIFLSFWAGIQGLLHLFEIGRPTTSFLRGMRPPGATIPFGPLWFLAVYLGVILLSPATIALHRRFGAAIPAIFAAGIVAADLAGFVWGHHEVRWVNVGLAFLLPHQIGYFYADGRLKGLSKKSLTMIAGAGLATMIALTNPIFGEAGERWFPGIGHYPKSLMGTDVEPMSNTLPPTVVLAAMTFWSISLALLARPVISAWLQGPRFWQAVILANRVIMTLFLWHMTAFLIAVIVLWPFGFGRESDTTARWWLERPLWLGLPALFLGLFIAIFGRFERNGPKMARLPASSRP